MLSLEPATFYSTQFNTRGPNGAVLFPLLSPCLDCQDIVAMGHRLVSRGGRELPPARGRMAPGASLGHRLLSGPACRRQRHRPPFHRLGRSLASRPTGRTGTEEGAANAGETVGARNRAAAAWSMPRAASVGGGARLPLPPIQRRLRTARGSLQSSCRRRRRRGGARQVNGAGRPSGNIVGRMRCGCRGGAGSSNHGRRAALAPPPWSMGSRRGGGASADAGERRRGARLSVRRARRRCAAAGPPASRRETKGSRRQGRRGRSAGSQEKDGGGAAVGLPRRRSRGRRATARGGGARTPRETACR